MEDTQNRIIGLDGERTPDFTKECRDGRLLYRYPCHAKAVYGLGERYCSVNHKGRTLVNRVIERFTRQGEDTYFPLPFYHVSDGHGVFVDTLCEVTFRFKEEEIQIELAQDAPHRLRFYYGSAAQIIKSFRRDTGKAALPPKWAFGVWASANRWSSQEEVERQLRLMEDHEYPVSVIVLEAWSDEATFYIWNGAEYEPGAGEGALRLKDFTFHEPWPDPVGLIKRIHESGKKLILWQVPALKLLEEGRSNAQHEKDCAWAALRELVVKDAKGKPYRIPRQWFVGSMLPDFTNPRTCDWWKEKRRYLLEEMRIDGFKTDGGEFIHDTDTLFSNGQDGRQERNAYPARYEQTYGELVGNRQIPENLQVSGDRRHENRYHRREGILFSRAGYLGAQQTPLHWAGDQVSAFDELSSVLRAGLSLSLSGIPFWSFDIAGFAGPLPDKELYLRSTALAAFAPAMQWHSEPASGQFEAVLKGNGGVNDRSPWNLAEHYEDKSILVTARFFACLHMNFLPFFYSEAIKAVEEDLPFLRPLALDYGTEEEALLCEDEYRIGDLLVAPVTEEGAGGREVYLPPGVWYDFFDGTRLEGGRRIRKEAPLERIPLYLKENGAVCLSLSDTLRPGDCGAKGGQDYENFCVVYAGEEPSFVFRDENTDRTQDTKQDANQDTAQDTDQATAQDTKKDVDQATARDTAQDANQATARDIKQDTNQAIARDIKQDANQATARDIKQDTNQAIASDSDPDAAQDKDLDKNLDKNQDKNKPGIDGGFLWKPGRRIPVPCKGKYLEIPLERLWKQDRNTAET